jgi:protoheme IX farnesyltransferase
MGSRTEGRPVATGRVPAARALEFGLALSAFSFVLLDGLVNLPTALLALAGNLFYVVVYTRWLKRTTAQNIVIGGAAGAVPPLVGYAGASGHLGWAALVMFAIVFIWTPPHFWALALLKKRDYERAGIPMLPNVAGDDETRKQILLYSLVLAPVGVAPFLLGMTGWLYGAISIALGALFLVFAWQVYRKREGEAAERAAKHLFAFSVLYLFLLFAVLLGEGMVR